MITKHKQWMVFGAWVALTLLVFWKPVYGIVQLALQDETSSHILLIPLISAWLIYTVRNQSEPVSGFSFWHTAVFLVTGLIFAVFAWHCSSCSSKNRLSAYAFSLILLLIGGFVLILGKARARTSSFGLAFLLFCIPIPDALLGRLIYWLQSGSAAIAEIFFNLSGAPVLREGFVFRLPRISIEVAQECSGIRSSLALLILALLVAHFSFQPFWKKLVFVLAGLCMMLIKNGIRIAALTLLANYVNPNFLYGSLHHQGGVVFFLIGLALLLPVFWLLRKGEFSGTENPLRAPAH
jgi:exosortase